MAELRLALIGCGSHAESAHAKPLAHFAERNPGILRLAAACDIDRRRAERFCAEYGFANAYSDPEAMLDAETPDAVVSVLPIEKTAEVGAMLLRRGTPCVLEKPPGRSLAEARGLAEVARETGTPHMVSMNRRFNPYLNRALAWTKEHEPPRFIHGKMLRHARKDQEFLWGTGIHIVDAMRYVGGDVTGWNVQTLRAGSDSTPWFVVTLKFASGCEGLVEIFPTCGAVDESFTLYGEGCSAEARTMGPKGESVKCVHNGIVTLDESAGSGDPLFLRDGSYEETSAFIHTVRQRSPLRPTLDDVLPSLEICAQ